MLRLDSKPIPNSAGDCRAFMTVMDEAIRLPHSLDYHRRLGIHRFFICDNGSRDGSVEFLLQQPDCHVFQTRESYAAARYGMNWINKMVSEYGDGHWCLFVDADEIFVYPYCEQLRLPELCHHLSQTGANGMFSFLLDMYNDGPIAEAKYRAGSAFLDTSPFFDKDYVFRPTMWRPIKGRPFPYKEPVGGPRLRRFYPNFVNASSSRYALAKAARSLRNFTQRTFKTNFRFGIVPPLLTKIPLMLGGEGRCWATSHKTVTLGLSEVTGILLHFKYFADFHERVITSLGGKEHFDGGSEYDCYARTLQTDPMLSFHHSGSIRYVDSTQLLDLGFIESSRKLDQLAGEKRGVARLYGSVNC